MSITHVDFSRRSVVSEPIAPIDPDTLTPSHLDSLGRIQTPKPQRERKPSVIVSGLRWKPRKQRFEAANVTFDPETQEAYSYGWWRFVERIGPYLVFNSYRYSVTTSKHQSRMWWRSYWRDDPEHHGLLAELGLSVDLEIEAPRGLQNLPAAIAHYESRIEGLESAISRKGSRKAKNAERRAAITEAQIKIATVKTLMALRDAEDKRAEASL